MISVGTGYKEFDDNIGQLKSGCVYLLAGMHSMGKTSMALNFLRNMSIIGEQQSIYFSVRKTEKQMREMLLTMELGIEGHILDKEQLTQKELKRVTDSMVKISNHRYIFYENSLDVNNICLKIIQDNKKCGSVVFIDDFDEIINKGNNREATLEKLKDVAMKESVTIIIIENINNHDISFEDDYLSGMQLLNDYGHMSDIFEKLFIIHRPEYFEPFTDESHISLIKSYFPQKRELKTARLLWIGKCFRFMNIENHIH